MPNVQPSFSHRDSEGLFNNHSPYTEVTSLLQAPVQAPSQQQQPDLSAWDLSQEDQADTASKRQTCARVKGSLVPSVPGLYIRAGSQQSSLASLPGFPG